MSVSVSNQIRLNSAACHIPNKIGIENPTGPGPFGTVDQTIRFRATTWGVSTLLLLTVACARPPSHNELCGVYELASKQGRITLEFLESGSFFEVIEFGDGRRRELTGGWVAPTAESPKVAIQGLWVPGEFSPDYIQRADTANKGDVPKYSEPGLWLVSPTRLWNGDVFLVIYPDADIGFRRRGAKLR